MMNSKRMIGVAVVLILVVCTVAGLIILLKVKPREDKITAAIREAMKKPNVTVSAANDDKAQRYADKPEDLLSNSFPKWNRDSEVLSDLCLFTINLMEYVVANGEEDSPIYPKIIRTVVESIKNELEKKPFRKTSIPWGKNWFPFSVYVTRLFAMFQYFGGDSSLGYECHKQLVRLVSSVGVSLRPPTMPHKELNLFYMIVPRLCSNYMYDYAQYEEDIDTKAFKELKEFLLLKPKNFDEISEGVYPDDSCIYSENVASYVSLRLFDDFHDCVYRAFGFPTGFKDAARRILPKILHPKIPFVPLGLFGRTGQLINYRNYSLEFLDHGVFVAPFIGFGVFKTPEMLFYVRVQRPKIAAYQIKQGEGSKDLALGWVQMRKIWHKNEAQRPEYQKEMIWEKLKNQPGLLTFKNEVNYSDSVFVDDGEVTSFWPQKINSFIGQVNKDETNMSKKLLFWKNSYKFPKAYKNQSVEITEAAVVTDKGLQAHYTIDNNSGEELKFNYKDTKYFESASVNGKSKDPFYTVPTGTSLFTWKMLNDEVDYNVSFDASNGMTFTFLNKQYKAIVQEENESFRLECDGSSELYYAKPQ